MAKTPTPWVSQDGSSRVTNANAGVKRVEQDSITLRIEQDGTQRVLQDAVVTPKELTKWDTL
jgi:hypothetical protein